MSDRASRSLLLLGISVLKALWFSFLFLISSAVNATASAPSVFYPLPTKSQGKVIAAKQLFLADGGGIWFHDVRNQVLFFDGVDVFPESGSALDHTAERMAYLDNAFWTYFDNEIYRSIPNHEKELIFSLLPGTEILNIGASQRYVWVSDESNFYTYHIDSGEFKTYSLMEIYQYNPTANITINGASFIFSKWVLATNSGVYLSDQHHFSHIASSGKNYVEKLYFSPQRREVIIGSLNGALIFNIENPSDPVRHIADSHVLSIAETGHEYWIGTDKGLFVYSHLTGKTSRFEHGFWAGKGLDGEKIYALLNDQAGGMWIATDRGIRYFSQFSEKFQRHTPGRHIPNMYTNGLSRFTRIDFADGYWLLTPSGLMRASLSERKVVQVYKGQVNDFFEKDGLLFLATNQGVVCIDIISGEIVSGKLPNYLKRSPIQYIEAGEGEEIWGASDRELWSYHLQSKALEQYGSDWVLDKYFPAKLTTVHLFDKGSIALGTEHGLYLLRNGQIHFISDSVQYGEVISVEKVKADVLWIAARYGLYQVNTVTKNISPLSMANGHVTPQCILSNDEGIWLTSSAGLSRFTENGQLIQHYGEPFGLINNEFRSTLCSYGTDGSNTLVLGTSDSFLTVDTQQLIVSPPPQVQVIYSQIKLNQVLYSLGNNTQTPLQMSYGDSLTLQLGMLPRVNSLELEYRIDEEGSWSPLEGTTLTFEHLLPGEYHLEVRAVSEERVRSNNASYHFSVSKPWFLSGYAIASYLLLTILLITAMVYWRSRMMSKANHELTEQVALKTNQLSHQSRILLANNHQLRKQLQVRRLIFSQSIDSLKQRMGNHTMNGDGASQIDLSRFTHELEQLLNVREIDGEALPVYNLNVIINSVMNAWREEFFKAGISLEFPNEDDTFVKLMHFNLDELLTVLFDGIVKRSYRNQTITVQVTKQDGLVSLVVLDQGDSLDSSALLGTSMQSLTELVNKSGGEMKSHSSTERNLIEITWPEGEAFDEETVTQMTTEQEMAPNRVVDPWLDKLTALVAQHYSDPEFGTSLAAKLMFVSERSLQRRLKSAFEKTFTEYLTEVRLDHACRRLLAGAKVSDVAFDCGFNDPSYFSQRFKHRFGMSPTQFVEGHES